MFRDDEVWGQTTSRSSDGGLTAPSFRVARTLLRPEGRTKRAPRWIPWWPVADSFGPGDHLRVWRRLYFHHGIFTGDDIVVQFGGRVLDKPHARISAVPLA